MDSPYRLLVSLLLCALFAEARADSTIALDYQSRVKGCPSADRLSDEVSAKLGFAPWDAQAPTSIRVRITADGGELVATIEQPDGSNKVLRAATCAKLGEVLVSTIAVALDRSAPQTPKDERRLRKLERNDTGDKLLTINLRVKDGRLVEVSRLVASAFVTVGMHGGTLTSYDKLCKTPCTARVPAGTTTLLVRDLSSGTAAMSEADVTTSSTLELDYTSHADVRRTTIRRAKWGFLVGALVGTVATAYLVEANNGSAAYHTFDPLGGLTGGLVGVIVARVMSPGLPNDEMRIAVHPGL